MKSTKFLGELMWKMAASTNSEVDEERLDKWGKPLSDRQHRELSHRLNRTLTLDEERWRPWIHRRRAFVLRFVTPTGPGRKQPTFLRAQISRVLDNQGGILLASKLEAIYTVIFTWVPNVLAVNRCNAGSTNVLRNPFPFVNCSLMFC